MKSDYIYVDDTAGIADLCAKLQSHPHVALDTEGNSLYAYFERVCLIQASFDGQHYLIDPLCGADLRPLYDALARCPLLLHAADNDFRQLYSEAKFVPKAKLFDTLLAAQLLGRQQLSLAALVEESTGVVMCKRGQKSNWGKRPLTDSQLSYAVDDTRYLFQIAEEQEKELIALGRLSWHEESCERSSQAGLRQSDKDPGEAWRIRGAGHLRRREMAYLRELWTWRDTEARAANKPPFKILGNEPLMDLARWGAAHPGRPIHKGPRLPKHCAGKRFASLERSLGKANGLPKEKWPEPRTRIAAQKNGPSFRHDTEVLKSACHRVSDELAIQPSVIAPRAALENIARSRPNSRGAVAECSSLMNWQIDLLHDDILALFDGRANLAN